MLDGNVLLKPDYALGYEVVTLMVAGLVLALGLPLLPAAVRVTHRNRRAIVIEFDVGHPAGFERGGAFADRAGRASRHG